MRDGNCIVFEPSTARKSGFEPTYEGWKHVVALGGLETVLRFEPTYEGWKLLN